MAGINYQCNVQHPTGGDNLGCGKIFESLDDLPPSQRLCSEHRAKSDKPVAKAPETAATQSFVSKPST